MEWVLAGLSAVGFVELFSRFPVKPTLRRFMETANQAVFVLQSRNISDHWKEKVLPRYALNLFTMTILLTVYLAAAFIPFVLLAGIATAAGISLLQFGMSMMGVLFMTILSIGYATVRFKRAPAKL